ncbi:uncharacterized protein J3R85_001921 [Psidium guajava]|nr:uncharacterized protein J3R85_001921 [Psidium guajava]
MEQIPKQESLHPPTATDAEEISTTKERYGLSIIWKHFTKMEDLDKCPNRYSKHCTKSYNFVRGQGYGTFTRHLRLEHPTELEIDTSQQQISRYVNLNTSPLFRFNEKTHRED